MDPRSRDWYPEMELPQRNISFDELMGLERNRILENSSHHENQNPRVSSCHPENYRFMGQPSFPENQNTHQNGELRDLSLIFWGVNMLIAGFDDSFFGALLFELNTNSCFFRDIIRSGFLEPV